MICLGIDIGCISLKAALVGEAGDCDLFAGLAHEHPDLYFVPAAGLPEVGGRPVLVTAYRRLKGSPSDATRAFSTTCWPPSRASGSRACV